MTTPRLCVAAFGGVIALTTLCFGILHRSAEAWRLLVALVPLLLVFIWWMVDRAALERRVRRLEARSEIADERRVTAQVDITEVEHRLYEIEDRVVGIEHSAGPAHVVHEREDLPETENGIGNTRNAYVDITINARPH